MLAVSKILNTLFCLFQLFVSAMALEAASNSSTADSDITHPTYSTDPGVPKPTPILSPVHVPPTSRLRSAAFYHAPAPPTNESYFGEF